MILQGERNLSSAPARNRSERQLLTGKTSGTTLLGRKQKGMEGHEGNKRRMRMREFGYILVSSKDQNEERQRINGEG